MHFVMLIYLQLEKPHKHTKWFIRYSLYLLSCFFLLEVPMVSMARLAFSGTESMLEIHRFLRGSFGLGYIDDFYRSVLPH